MLPTNYVCLQFDAVQLLYCQFLGLCFFFAETAA